MDAGNVSSRRAVVVGASISGLLAARVLADHFAQVTVIERDVLPPLGEPRKGVPQGRHVHVLLSRGRDLLEGFFPGLTANLEQHGALVSDLAENVIWYSAGDYTRRYRSGLIGVQASRPLLEGLIARRVRALPNVTLLENHDAAGLLSAQEAGQARVTGVRVVDRGASPPAERELDAALVVDAAGRGSRVMAWLDALGYPRPEEERIKMDLSYTSRIFRRLPEHAGGRNPVVILPGVKNRRAGVMLAVEGGRWLAVLSGLLGDSAPGDLEGFLAFARSLEAPDIYDILKTAEPLGEPATYKYAASQRRRFEKLARFPQGLLVTGDALCSFNPIYGQGMTTAASEAALLDACLREDRAGRARAPLSRRFFRRAGKLLDSPWSIAAGSDLAYPEVEGKRPLAGRLIAPYMTRLLLATRYDPVLNLAFQRVTNLLAPPASLFAPKIMLRVLFGQRGPRRPAAASGAAPEATS